DRPAGRGARGLGPGRSGRGGLRAGAAQGRAGHRAAAGVGARGASGGAGPAPVGSRHGDREDWGRRGGGCAARDPGHRFNALRALATFHDTAFARLAVPLVGDADVNVAVQAETTLGVLGGRVAVAALGVRLASAVFALRRQALIALAQADSAAGATAAAALPGDADWRWRSVAAEVFGAAHDRPRLE